MKRSSITALVWLSLLLTLSQPAHAYLDVGSISYFFQVAVVSIFGVVFALRTQLQILWAKFTGLFKRRSPSDNGQ